MRWSRSSDKTGLRTGIAKLRIGFPPSTLPPSQQGRVGAVSHILVRLIGDQVLLDASAYPNLEALVEEVLRSWPEHEKYIQRSFANRSDDVLRASDHLSAAIVLMSKSVPGGLATLCDDYKYTSENIILPEELYFRRRGEYRLKTFEDANRECYSNPGLMARYMNGLAVSDVIWENHAGAVSAFLNQYLPGLAPGARHLEVGPGHGFFLYFAAADPKVASLTGWDVSPTSVEHTRQVLDVLGVEKDIDLKVQDLFEAGAPEPGAEFDSIVISEVLEHLEDPYLALRSLSAWLRPEGKIWINVPVNCPAPDHIYQFHEIEETHELVRACGLKIVQQDSFPITGATLEKAIKRKQTISCVITATKST
jgi:2-polyprenyl-3-methyl-5-hydroxy-6-metoxy-1,4-benzoquinol methylase